MKIEIFESKQQLGGAAAADGAKAIRKALKNRGEANIIIATGASQFDTLAALVAEPDLDWRRITMFHLDEYVGIPATHPASFRRYIRERFEQKLPSPLKAAHYLDGDAADPQSVCAKLGEVIRRHPIDVAFVGIGENGHLAFNDPPADFTTEEPYLVVELDERCRRQQLGEGWFPSMDAVPRNAISMSVKWIMRSALIINSVPDARKAEAVRNAVEGSVSPLCPASILQKHPNCALYLDQPAASLLKPSSVAKSGFSFNGIMMDCARLMENHSYYFKLLDFMAHWKMNTLVLHFSDDQGLAIALPGFEELATPDAFRPDEITALLDHARTCGVDIIPELETFGHIRYLTNHAAYAHLFAGSQGDAWAFNAIDPTNPESLAVLDRLLAATCSLFDSPYLHIGCDEVDMSAFCRERGLDEARVWADHVNRVIALVRARGRTPMMWADHPGKSEVIAEGLRKDVILLDWRYEPDLDPAVAPRLQAYGFQAVVGAPSASCYQARFHTSCFGFENIRNMIGVARQNGYAGVMNTVWCPYRHYQDGIWQALAYGAELARQPEGLDMDRFRREFAERELNVAPTDDVLTFLARAPLVEFDFQMAAMLLDPPSMRYNHVPPEAVARNARRSRELGDQLLPLLPALPDNLTFRGMKLAVKSAWVSAEALCIQEEKSRDPVRLARYRAMLDQVLEEARAYWVEGRSAREFAEPPLPATPPNARLVNLLKALPRFENSSR